MSERFIFNKKLNRRHRHLPWLMVTLVLVLAGRWMPAQAQDRELIDPDAQPAPSYKHELQDIQFHRSGEQGAKAIFVLSEEGFDSVIAENSQGVQLLLPATKLAEDQLYKLDVTDFGTPVKWLETFQDEDGTRVQLATSAAVTVSHQVTGNSLVLELEEKQAASDAEVVANYTGAPVSLDFQDVPVRQVLQVIAQINGFNLVTTDTVTGNVTISLTDVPWDQALGMILKIKGLDKRLEGNILLVAPAEEMAARETQRLQSKQQVAELSPLVSETIQINYAKASEMATILKSGEGGILSTRGTVTVDSRTNSLLVRDTRESIQEAKEMVKKLDIPIKQVLIESRMVTVRDNVDEQLGVRWGFSDLQDDTGVSGSLAGAETIAGGTIPALAERLNVNLPVAGTSAGRIGFHIAKLADGTILDLELSALEQENKGEIIASPRITVANQHEAYIEQGTEIPYVQATSSGATSVEFKKAVLSLKVTPHITPDNRIILDLVVTQDTRGDTVNTSTGPAVAIDTQEISTQVLVENGETVVLGGIFQQNLTDAVSKVPLFGDLPLVGNLFKNTSKLNEKRELLIFVTPRIMTEAL